MKIRKILAILLPAVLLMSAFAVAAYNGAVYEDNGVTRNYIDVIIENANS